MFQQQTQGRELQDSQTRDDVALVTVARCLGNAPLAHRRTSSMDSPLRSRSYAGSWTR